MSSSNFDSKPLPGPASLDADSSCQAPSPHPAGPIKYTGFIQIIRLLLLASWFNCCCASIHITQLVGSPLYFINRDYFYAYMALTKQSFGHLIITITQWFSPTVIRVSGDKSVRGQLIRTKDGYLKTDFPERLILINNHQIYIDWLYLWWISYTGRMHGHVYIILKESLKYIPFIGPGMMFYGFVFMARNWAADKARLQYRLEKLKSRHSGPLSGTQSLDPMWMIIYPEGTNLSANTRKASAKWAAKQGIEDFKHVLIPRSTGLQFVLKELKGTVDWVYDCTTAYEGVRPNDYAQDYFTLRSVFFQGRAPKAVNMYWRRFPVSSIPVDDPIAFEVWINRVWQEKEDLLADFKQNGRFPADEGTDVDNKIQGATRSEAAEGAGFIETEVRLENWWEVGQIFVFMATYAMIADILANAWKFVLYGSFSGASLRKSVR